MARARVTRVKAGITYPHTPHTHTHTRVRARVWARVTYHTHTTLSIHTNQK